MDASSYSKSDGEDGIVRMSTEALIMSLLGQIHELEEERDSARLLAVRMRERLEQLTGKSAEENEATTNNNITSNGNIADVGNKRIAKLLRDVTSTMVHDLKQLVLNEEQRAENLRELTPDKLEAELTSRDSESDQYNKEFSFERQIAQYKEHYEKLLTEAENEKDSLRKMVKVQQDLVLDRDIKLKDLQEKLNNNTT